MTNLIVVDPLGQTPRLHGVLKFSRADIHSRGWHDMVAVFSNQLSKHINTAIDGLSSLRTMKSHFTQSVGGLKTVV